MNHEVYATGEPHNLLENEQPPRVLPREHAQVNNYDEREVALLHFNFECSINLQS